MSYTVFSWSNYPGPAGAPIEAWRRIVFLVNSHFGPFLFIAVTLAGHGSDPCFGWTSGRRWSLAGTKVVAVSESRLASLGNSCSLLTYRTVMIESLKEASLRGSPHNHSIFGHSLSFIWHRRIHGPAWRCFPAPRPYFHRLGTQLCAWSCREQLIRRMVSLESVERFRGN